MGIEILVGDCRDALKRLPAESVQSVVTSPPYYHARDYDHADQIGLETSPAEYCAALVEVFHEVWRVLRPDGTCFVNLGDSYAGSWGNQGQGNSVSTISEYQRAAVPKVQSGAGSIPPGSGLKPKDLIGIPWRVAFALQDAGWWLRSEIIWSKPNPMPESMLDRCTKAHEQIFVLTKSGAPTIWRHRVTKEWSDAPDMTEVLPRPTLKNPDAMVPAWRAFDYFWDADAIAELTKYPPGGSHDDRAQGGFNDKGKIPGTNQRAFRAIRETRNKRSVWTVASQGIKEAHFAAMPADLVRPMILAGSREGDLILDPFGGAGTTGLVAQQLRRRAVLIELNPEYAAMAKRRLGQEAGLFAEVSVA